MVVYPTGQSWQAMSASAPPYVPMGHTEHDETEDEEQIEHASGTS